MLNIGCYLSSSKGFLAMGKTALVLGANTFQFFTRNPRGSKAKEMNPADAASLMELLAANDFAPILAHAPYTLNAASADLKTREFAWLTIEDDLARMEYTPGNLYNFHPGSHVGQGMQEGIALIVRMLTSVLKPEYQTTVLLETMAGKGSEVGSRFEELQAIIEGVEAIRPELVGKVGVCLDTCHVYDAGYDIVGNLEGVLDEFDAKIGINRLKAIHINDSKNLFESHKDRHEKIGEGAIGLAAFTQIINHPKLRRLPFYLETPNELDGYAQEIALLRSVYKE